VKRIGVPLLLLISTIVFSSCSFAPEDAVGDQRPAAFPDMRLEQTRYVLGMEGASPLRIDAQTIELYREAGEAYIDNATFTQDDTAGELLFSGSFGKAIVDTETNDVVMSGGVEIHNHRDDFMLSAVSLTWHHGDKIVEGDSDTLVTIVSKEHDILKGTGFRGDFSTATFEFMYMEEGRLTYD
jgi:hypothetical protein